MAPITSAEQSPYQVAVICPATSSVLALKTGNGACFPTVPISANTRKAIQVSNALRAEYGISGIVLEFLQTQEGMLAVVEWLDCEEDTTLVQTPLKRVPEAVLNPGVRDMLATLLEGGRLSSDSPFTALGWWADALE